MNIFKTMMTSILRYCAAFFLALFAIGAVVFYFPPFQRFLSTQIEKSIESFSSGKVRVEGLYLSSPITVSASEIIIRDPGKTKTQLKDVSLMINPLTLFSSKWELSSVHISSLEAHLISSEDIPMAAALPFSLWQFSVEHFSLRSFQIFKNSVPLFPSSIAIEGRFSNNESKGILSSAITAKMPKATKGSLHISLKSFAQRANPSTTLTLQDKGLIEHLFNFAVKSRLQISAPESAPDILSRLQNFTSPLAVDIQFDAKNAPLDIASSYAATVKGIIEPDWSFHLKEIDTITPYGKVTGELTVNSDSQWENSQLFIEGDIKPLTKFLPIGIQAPITTTIVVTGPFKEPKLLINGQAEKANFKQFTIVQTKYEAQLDFKEEALFSINASMQGRDSLWVLATQGHWDYKDEITLTSSSLTRGANSFNMKGKWNISSTFFKGELDAQIQELPSEMGRLPFSTSLAGISGEPFHIKSYWYGEGGKQSVSFRLSTKYFAWEQELAIQDLLLKADLREVFDNPKGTIELTSGPIRYGIYEGASLALQVQSEDAARWDYTLNTTSQQDHAFGSGFVQFSPEAVSIHCQELSMIVDGSHVELLEEFDFLYSKDGYVLNPLQLSVEQGTLWVAGSLAPKAVNFVLQMERFPLKFLPTEELTGYNFHGLTTAKVMIMGKPDAPTGSVEISFSELLFKEELDYNLPPIRGEIFAKIFSHEMEAYGSFFGKDTAPIKVETKIPGKLSLAPPYFHLDRQAPFSLDFEASGEISSLLELFLTDNSFVSGKGNVNIAVRGTLHTPKVTGTASLTQGIFENHALGTYFQNIETSIAGEGRRLQLLELKATDGEKGVIKGSGEIDLIPDKSFPFSINFSLEDVQLLKTDYVRSSFSGNLKMAGNKEVIDLTGDLAVSQTEINIPQQIPEVTETVKISYINQDPLMPPPTIYTREAYFDSLVRLDITLTTPKNFFIRSQDLRSEWSGKVQILGDFEHPIVKGDVNLVQGSYFLNGSVYNINQGKMNFAGDFYEKSTLNASAAREIDNYQVEIVVKGKLLDPYLVLRSTPPLSRHQLLSLILFGQAADNFTPLQTEQIEQSLANLTTASDPDQVNTLNRIQKNLGIDNIRFMRSETGIGQETSIQVGKYITRNVYLSVNRALSDEVNHFALEANITKNLRGRISATSNGEGEAAIFWHHDY